MRHLHYVTLPRVGVGALRRILRPALELWGADFWALDLWAPCDDGSSRELTGFTQSPPTS